MKKFQTVQLRPDDVRATRQGAIVSQIASYRPLARTTCNKTADKTLPDHFYPSARTKKVRKCSSLKNDRCHVHVGDHYFCPSLNERVALASCSRRGVFDSSHAKAVREVARLQEAIADEAEARRPQRAIDAGARQRAQQEAAEAAARYLFNSTRLTPP